jgi:peptidylprolyl isomerase
VSVVPRRPSSADSISSPFTSSVSFRLVPLVAATALLLAGCGGSTETEQPASSASGSVSASPSAAPSPSGVAAASEPVRTTKIGVSVTGDLGDKPALTVPAGAAPSELASEVLVTGKGAAAAKGETLVVNYLGQTWDPPTDSAGGSSSVNVFDNSYDRAAPAAFPIGVGKVITGWDTALVGAKAGSRLLLSVPPAQAYGTDPKGHELGGQTLLFVVDVLGSLPATAAAKGSAVSDLPAGYPKVSSAPGKEPAVTSVAGVTVPKQSQSTMLVNGSGASISPTATLALQLVSTDTATGKQTQTWEASGIQLVKAADVISVATVLEGKKVGSRALVVTADQGNGSGVLIIDVVGQY